MDASKLAVFKTAASSVRLLHGTVGDLQLGDCLFVEASPLPPQDELLEVLADIDRNRVVLVRDGVVRHNPECKVGRHHLRREIRLAAEKLQNTRLNVALFEGVPTVLKGQPLVIPLEPRIDYSTYPDHKHLNLGGRIPFFLPETVCYTDSPAALGDTPEERAFCAWLMTCVWLVRHLLWVETHGATGTGTWIGPEHDPFPRRALAPWLDPDGPCRCGSRTAYGKCCLSSDLASLKRSKDARLAEQLNIPWALRVGQPRSATIQLLRQVALTATPV